MKETSLDFLIGFDLYSGNYGFAFQSEDNEMFGAYLDIAKRDHSPHKCGSIKLQEIISLRDFLNEHIRRCEDESKTTD